MADYALQRLNMVESQVRPSDLTDRRIGRAMSNVSRESYLPEALLGVAYSDSDLPLSEIEAAKYGRQILSPRTVAHMLQALVLDENDVVLLVGAGCGYEAALLSQIVQTVVGVESDAGLADWAEGALNGQDVSNAVIVRAALEEGVAKEGPFNAIMINGGVDEVPVRLLDQLKDGGRLVAVQRKGGMMHLVRWQRRGEHFSEVQIMSAGAAVLPGFAKEEAFVF